VGRKGDENLAYTALFHYWCDFWVKFIDVANHCPVFNRKCLLAMSVNEHKNESYFTHGGWSGTAHGTRCQYCIVFDCPVQRRRRLYNVWGLVGLVTVCNICAFSTAWNARWVAQPLTARPTPPQSVIYQAVTGLLLGVFHQPCILNYAQFAPLGFV